MLNFIHHYLSFGLHLSMCENFLGCHPHWGLFKYIFTCRSMAVKKDSSIGEKTHVTQLCRGMGIQVRGGRSFPKMSFPDSIKGWQGTWFYCSDIPSAHNQPGLTQYSSERV